MLPTTPRPPPEPPPPEDRTAEPDPGTKTQTTESNQPPLTTHFPTPAVKYKIDTKLLVLQFVLANLDNTQDGTSLINYPLAGAIGPRHASEDLGPVGVDPDADCLPPSHYPTVFGPPDPSADVNTRAHHARCYPRGSESSDMNEVDTRPMTSATSLMTSMPFLYDYMSHSAPAPSLLPLTSSLCDVRPTAVTARAHRARYCVNLDAPGNPTNHYPTIVPWTHAVSPLLKTPILPRTPTRWRWTPTLLPPNQPLSHSHGTPTHAVLLLVRRHRPGPGYAGPGL